MEGVLHFLETIHLSWTARALVIALGMALIIFSLRDIKSAITPLKISSDGIELPGGATIVFLCGMICVLLGILVFDPYSPLVGKISGENFSNPENSNKDFTLASAVLPVAGTVFFNGQLVGTTVGAMEQSITAYIYVDTEKSPSCTTTISRHEANNAHQIFLPISCVGHTNKDAAEHKITIKGDIKLSRDVRANGSFLIWKDF